MNDYIGRGDIVKVIFSANCLDSKECKVISTPEHLNMGEI